jgi:hypothetical protein
MAKISTYPIVSVPDFSDLLIGTDVENLNETKNFTIGDIADLIIVGSYVPYTGAINDVDLGTHSITASSFIVPGGLASQFVKADGSLDSTVYQPAGNYMTGLSGEATASGPGVSAVVLNNGAVVGKVLTGLTITGGSISSSDSILQAFGKLQNQVNSLYGGAIYQGTWNALTNNPLIQSGVGTKGYYYVVNVAGSTNIDGITDWNVGDWIIFDGTAWQQVDNTDTVVSVNGKVGVVVLTTTDIAEGTNLYYTDVRARGALLLTTVGNSGASTYNSSTGTFNIPNYTLSGLGGVPSSRQLSINGTAYDLSADRSWSVGTVTSIGTSGPLTGGTITGSGTIGITQSGASLDGYLSSTDWNTFNNKQNALTNPVTGTGTVYYLPMWSGLTTLTDSIISYTANVINYNYNSASGATVNYININGTPYTYTIQMNNVGTRQTYHSYTDGNIIQRINGNDVSRNLSTGQLVLPSYTTLTSFTGTTVGYIGFDASGNILTVPVPTAGITGSGASGQVAYWNGTSSQTGSATFVWDNANTKLNIGTNAGNIINATNVNVVGSGAISGVTIQNTTATNAQAGYFLLNSSGDYCQTFKASRTYAAYKIITNGDFGLYNGAFGDISILNDVGKIKFSAGASTAQMTLTSAGRLLLGTTTESTFILDVNGSARITGSSTMEQRLLVKGNDTTGLVGTGLVMSYNTQGQIQAYDYTNSVYKNILIGGGSTVYLGSQSYTGGGTINMYGITEINAAGNIFPFILKTPNTTDYFYTQIRTGATDRFAYGYQPVVGGFVLYNNQNTTFPFVVFNSTSNVAINSSTDAGYKLDVNGTARVSTSITSPQLTITNRLDIFSDGSNGVIVMQNLANTLCLRKFVKVLGDNGGYGNNDASAAFQIDGTNRGFLQPRLTTTQKNAISSPAAGLQVYDSTTNAPNYYDGTAWVALGGGGTSIYTADGTLTSNRTVSSGGFSLVFNPQTAFETTLSAAPNDSTTALVSQNTLSYASGFSSTNIGNVYGAVAGINLQTFAGSATFETANLATAVASVNSIDFSSSGSTITMTQPFSSGIRAMTGHQSQIQYQGTNSGTITHAAISQNLGFYRPSAATGILTITNAYSLLINDLNDYGSGFTYTNRWAIYQDGASDNNYFKGKVIIGSTNTVGVSPLNVKDLPTSSAGLATGDVWNDSGTLKIA